MLNLQKVSVSSENLIICIKQRFPKENLISKLSRKFGVHFQTSFQPSNMSIIDQASGDYSSQVLLKLNQELYLSSELADVHFVCDTKPNGVERVRVPAQKLHLIAGSVVFRAMFNGPWKNKNEVEVDASASSFMEFLQFFYFDQVRLTMENIVEVMNLGKKYQIIDCLDVCSKFLRARLTIDNVCSLYGLAIVFDQDALKRACEIFIGYNAKVVFQSTMFLACSQNVLAEILKLNFLSCSEIELFKACMTWIKANSRKNVINKELIVAKLGDSFRDIRFGSMSLHEYADLIPRYGNALSFDEQQEIIQMIANENFIPKILSGNRIKRRNVDLLKGEMRIIGCRYRPRTQFMQPFKIKSSEITRFTTNEMVLLSAFGCNAVFDHNDNRLCDVIERMPSKVTVIETFSGSSEKVVLHTANIDLNLKGVTIAMPKPVLCKPGFLYEIQIEQKTTAKYCAMPFMKNQIQLAHDILIKFHDEPINPNDPEVTRGLVSNFAFYRV